MSERAHPVSDQIPSFGGAGVSAQRQRIPQPPPTSRDRPRIDDPVGVAEQASIAAAAIAAEHRTREAIAELAARYLDADVQPSIAADLDANIADRSEQIANVCEALSLAYADLAADARSRQAAIYNVQANPS